MVVWHFIVSVCICQQVDPTIIAIRVHSAGYIRPLKDKLTPPKSVKMAHEAFGTIDLEK